MKRLRVLIEFKLIRSGDESRVSGPFREPFTCWTLRRDLSVCTVKRKLFSDRLAADLIFIVILTMCRNVATIKTNVVLFYLSQDLQSEIETHRDVYTSLNGTGRKLLSSLSSQEDAVMLQRRLDEMNQRWNHLKAKSMAIRLVFFYITVMVI